MIDLLKKILFGERDFLPNNQEKKVAPVSKENATDEEEICTEEATTEPQKSEPEIDPEVLAIARKYGPIASGVVIEVSLQELLALIPRQRKRSDAYVGLQKKLMANYGTELRIIKKKGKIENG